MTQVFDSSAQRNTVTARNLAQSQKHLLNVVGSAPFLKNEGINNEVPFHICPFDPQITQDMQHAVRQLKNELLERGVTVIEINLYDLVIEILQREGDLDWLIENETTLSRDELKEQLQMLYINMWELLLQLEYVTPDQRVIVYEEIEAIKQQIIDTISEIKQHDQNQHP